MEISYSKVITTKTRLYVWEYSQPILSGYTRNKRDTYEALVESNSLTYEPKDRTVYSIHRTRSNIKYLVESNLTPFSKFATFTFRKKPKDRTEAIKAFKSFARVWQKKYNEKLFYLYVLEKGTQYTKRWHIHAVLFNDRYISLTEMRELWRYGSAQVHALDHNSNIGLYLVKYITKDTMKVSNKKGYISCLGLTQPSVVRYPERLNIDPEICDFIKHYTIPLYNNKGEKIGEITASLKEISLIDKE
jgi:hypothetical protein